MRRVIAVYGIGAIGSAIFAPAASAQETFVIEEGPPDFFIGILIFMGVVFILGSSASIWKFITVKNMAERRGLDKKEATAAALLSDDVTVAAMVLKDPEAPAEEISDRLATIDALREDGTITDEEAEAKRQEILGEI